MTPHLHDTTRAALHQVAVHVVARARVQASGRFSLRVTPGGFGTPEFGDTLRRVRVDGGLLIVEDDAPGAPSATALALDGRSLVDAAGLAGVDLHAPLDVGHDTDDVGDIHAPLTIHATVAQEIARWFALTAGALDRLLPMFPPDLTPTPVRLWPEHFDVAIDADARPGLRVNLGGSPGDGFSAEPYLYVGPWTADRPGGGGYWNAAFGAMVTASDVHDEADAIAFFTEGLQRLRG